jgi:hypothetical protein
MATEYEIKTIADFEQVPDDRICDCIQEFVICLLRTRTAREGDIRLRLEGFTWIDDGIPMVRSCDLRIGDTTENIPNPNFPQPE